MPKSVHETYLIDGKQTLQGNPTDLANLVLINDHLNVVNPANTSGTNVLVNSGADFGHLNNDGSIVSEDGSELRAQNLTGSGNITAIDGTIVIAGGAPTSETIGLVDHSQLYLGDDWTMGFLATVDMDASSTIHFYNSGTFTDPGSFIGSELAAAAHITGLLSDLAVVHSLTPGYAPVIQYQWSGPGDSGGIVGMEIVDKPIIACS